MKKMKTDLTNKILELHYQGKNNTEITKILNIQHRTVANHLKKSINYCALSNMSMIKRTYTLNENFFNEIITEEQSYWLGFLFADGYVYSSKKPNNGKFARQLKIVLNHEDIDHLYKFKDSISSNSPIKFYKYSNGIYPCITINNKTIVTDLIKLGCIQGKTHKLIFPTFLNDNLKRHFIRGYFDGDGCITKSNFINNKTSNINITGRKEFLFEIQKFFHEQIGLNFTKMSKRHIERNNDIFTIHYGGANIMKKLKVFFYDNSNIYLKRKFDKFNSWVI
jgi:intein/homing endonuclease